MIGIFILVFQILIIILYGIFIRTDATTTSSITSLESGLFFIVAYAFLNTKSRSLDWTVLTNFLFIVMICMQINTLYYYFWAEAFAKTFTSTSSLSSAVFVSGLQATLTVVITASMFTSKLSQLGLFVLTMIQVFFFALNWAICSWGINAITSGGTMTVWLFGLVFAACIKKLRYPQQSSNGSVKYFTKTLQVISLIIVIIIWPSLNQLMASLDDTVDNLASTAMLSQNAYIQTWLCLFSAIVTTLGLRVMGEKINLDKIISSIINTGILISSSACVIIDPFASILMGIIGPIIYYIYDRYAQSIQSWGYPIDSIGMAILGGILSSIFSGGRNGRTPSLSSDPVKQGGLQFASLIVSLLFAIVFGFLTGFILRFTSNQNTQITDMGIWQIQSEMMPLYGDDPKLQKLYKVQDQERLKQQNTNFSLKQRFMTESAKEPTNLKNTKVNKRSPSRAINQQSQHQSQIMSQRK